MDQTKMISFNSTGLESNIIVQNVFVACVYYENYIQVTNTFCADSEAICVCD